MIKKIFHNSSKKFLSKITKNTYISLSSILVIFLIILCFIFRVLITSNITKSESIRTKQVSDQLADYMQQCISISICLSQMISIPSEELNVSSQFWQNKIYEENLKAFLSSHNFISGIKLINKNTTIISGQYNSTIKTDTIGFFHNFRISCDESLKWPYFLRMEYCPENSNLSSVFLDIDLNYLSKLILPVNTYITDVNGNIIMNYKMDKYSDNLIDTFNLNKEFISAKQKNTSKFYTCVEQIERSDLYCCTITPISEYSNQFILIFILVITLGCLLLIILLFLTKKVITNIYKPINDIVETFKYHLPNNANTFENEVAYINTNIKNTLAANNELETKLNEKIVKIKIAQASALHSQINPHFLLNTLENIKWLSVESMGFENPIADSLIYLNSIVSESLNQSEMLTNVTTEVELTNNYIELMKIRYRDSFNVIWNVNSDCNSGTIIKLTLQPILENSIIHGFRQDKSGQLINISIKKDINILRIIVSDNGIGIPEEKFNEIKSLLKNVDNTTNKHVGLSNVNLRIKLLFGDNYGIQKFESNNTGTTVEVILPYSDFLP